MTAAKDYLETLGTYAKKARMQIATMDTAGKNAVLEAIAEALLQNTGTILDANAEDMKAAEANGTSKAMMDRLLLTAERISDIADAVRHVVSLPDPVGEVLKTHTIPNGLTIKKVRVPMGVIGIIYEARPNVTADAAALCLKTGNAVILRGGKDAIHSNKAIADTMRGALEGKGLDPNLICLVEDTSRDSATALMKLNGYLDVLIPRGGAALIQSVVENSTVPVIETGTGNCHVYVDRDADVKMAADIIYNAKTSRPSVCNACESIVVHEAIAEKALPLIAEKLKTQDVEIRADEAARTILTDAIPATDADFGTEYLDYIISVKTVGSAEEAVRHINEYSTGHSESIVTENAETAAMFLNGVDSAAVYWNASTRFTDGGEFGLGAEIGISTQKLHARGPMGLEELTSYKYVITGQGQVR